MSLIAMNFHRNFSPSSTTRQYFISRQNFSTRPCLTATILTSLTDKTLRFVASFEDHPIVFDRSLTFFREITTAAGITETKRQTRTLITILTGDVFSRPGMLSD